MTLSKVEKEIFLELIEEIDIAHDYIFANTDPKDNLKTAGKKLMKLKRLVQLT
jgi:hypothetical protein